MGCVCVCVCVLMYQEQVCPLTHGLLLPPPPSTSIGLLLLFVVVLLTGARGKKQGRERRANVQADTNHRYNAQPNPGVDISRLDLHQMMTIVQR